VTDDATLTAARTDSAVRSRVVLQHMGLVRHVARQILRASSQYLDVRDFESAGVIGLISAIERFDPDRGVPFEAYARIRIRGEILEEVRRNDGWGGAGMTRKVRRLFRELESLAIELEQDLGRRPSDDELADQLGVSVETVQSIWTDAFGARILRLDLSYVGDGDGRDDRHDGERAPTPPQDLSAGVEDSAITGELADQVLAIVAGLPEREQIVFGLRYLERLKVSDIADLLGLGSTRITQIHNDLLEHLAEGLRLPA
jgi:RNA polymerase sigma factor for flagellar operon FliA